MQKYHGVPAALPEPPSSSHVDNALADLPDFCFEILSASFLTLALRPHALAVVRLCVKKAAISLRLPIGDKAEAWSDEDGRLVDEGRLGNAA